MARFASGKYSLGISDRSGRAYRLKDMALEWTGMLVGRDEFEVKQPQLDPRHHITDPQALRISRPARTEPAVEVLLPFDSFKSSSSGSAVITVTEPGHGRSTGDTVRFRKVTDFDGFTDPPDELIDTGEMPHITSYLLACGYSDIVVKNFLGINAFSLIKRGWGR